MDPANTLALVACGVYFLLGLVGGAWRYLATRRSPTAEAPRYVSVAHSAALHYAFAMLVFLKLLEFSPYSDATNLAAVAVPVFFFSVALMTYFAHAALGDTDNQFRLPYHIGRIAISPGIFHAAVWLLILGEVGGFAVLFVGALFTLAS